MSAARKSETINLGGREFAPVSTSTIEHDYWLMSKIRAAGLDHVAKREEESSETFVARLLSEVIDSGSAFDLLGGLLLPMPLPKEGWSPACAIETAEFIKRLSLPDDKAIVQSQMISLLIGFFESGLSSLTISLSSSGDMEMQPGTVAA
jgi:hypothetical protein